eukprot:m.618782 g.618782  ORF g.618782 m.618782 type:complete len:1572 (-) comp58191_c0_seq1:134-4849(-)
MSKSSCCSATCRRHLALSVIPTSEESLRILHCLSPVCRQRNEALRERVQQGLARRKQLLVLQQKGSASPLINVNRRTSAGAPASRRTSAINTSAPSHRPSFAGMRLPSPVSRLSTVSGSEPEESRSGRMSLSAGTDDIDDISSRDSTQSGPQSDIGLLSGFPSDLPPRIPEFVVTAPDDDEKRTGIPSHMFRCYSAYAQCTTKQRCYSPRCRHFTSYWRCGRVRRMLARVLICIALRVQSLTPLASFVPRALHGYLRELTSSPSYEEVPSGASQTAAVLFADASGFTALTERLSRNPHGAEELCSILNGFFTILVDVVLRFNGDIVKFAGDAVSIVWAVGDSEDTPAELVDCVKLAVACSHELHRRLDNYRATEHDSLRLHMGIGAGQLTCLHVGGVFSRWEYVVSGPPMSQIAVAEPLAMPGETVISPEAYDMVRDFMAGTSLDVLRNDIRKHVILPEHYDYVRVESYRASLLPRLDGIAPLRLNHRHINLLKRYIPAAIQPALKAGHDEHLAELREVSVLFVKCKGISIEASPDGSCSSALENGQHLMLTIQHAVYAWEGSINKFLVDDKGMLVLCVFGLPPMSHADDALRAVGAARMLVDILPKNFPNAEVACSVGVATGRAFCGVVGSVFRREYTVMGDVVNLSARLMAAAGDNDILVDEATHAVSSRGYDFQELPAIDLKGKAAPCFPFRPTGVKKATGTLKSATNHLQSRDDEFAVLTKMLAAEGSRVIVLTGERGSGKSALVTAMVEEAPRQGYKVLVTHATAKEKSIQGSLDPDPDARTPTFDSWFSVFEGLFKQASEETGLTPEAWVLSALDVQYHCHASLLNAVVPGLQIPVIAPLPRTIKTMHGLAQHSAGFMGESLDEQAAEHEEEYSLEEYDEEEGDEDGEDDGEEEGEEEDDEYLDDEDYDDDDGDDDEEGSGSEGSEPEHDDNDTGLLLEENMLPQLLLNDQMVLGGAEAAILSQLATASLEDFPVSALTFQHKLIRMSQMLLQLLLHYASTNQTMVMLHLQMGTSQKPNVEAESWRLAHSVHRHCKERPPNMPKLVMVVVSRPLVNIAPIEFTEIADYWSQRGYVLQLKPLAPEHIRRQMYSFLEVPEVFPLPQELVTLIMTRAAGNPKHIDEILAQLRKEGFIGVENGRVFLLKRDLQSVTTPEKMIGAFMGMIDCLQPRHLLLVKVASTFESCFSRNMLFKLVSNYEDRSQIHNMIEALVESGIFIRIPKAMIPAEVFVLDAKATECYDFVSVILKQVVNKLMLDSNRQKLMADLSKMEMVNSIKMLVHIQIKLRKWVAIRRGITRMRSSSVSRSSRAISRSSSIAGQDCPSSPSFAVSITTIPELSEEEVTRPIVINSMFVQEPPSRRSSVRGRKSSIITSSTPRKESLALIADTVSPSNAPVLPRRSLSAETPRRQSTHSIESAGLQLPGTGEEGRSPPRRQSSLQHKHPTRRTRSTEDPDFAARAPRRSSTRIRRPTHAAAIPEVVQETTDTQLVPPSTKPDNISLSSRSVSSLSDASVHSALPLTVPVTPVDGAVSPTAAPTTPDRIPTINIVPDVRVSPQGSPGASVV